MQSYNIPIYGTLETGSKIFSVNLPTGLMKTFFDPVVNTILALVRECLEGIEQDPYDPRYLQAIILRGGLGSSPYVHDTILNQYPNVKVPQPEIGNSAPVAKGALLRYTLPIQRPIGHGWSLCCIQNENWYPQ
jgi:hypothetical protein